MRKDGFNTGWRLRRERLGKDTPVTLPHDGVIGMVVTPENATGRYTGFYPRACLEYRRTFRLTPEQRQETVLLEFDGVFANAYVTVNGDRVAFHPYGYTGFIADISACVRREGDNEVFVRADNMLDSSRWYTGAGIYRDVFLRTGPSVHIVPWSLRADAVAQEGDRTLVRFQADVAGASDAAARFELYQDGLLLHRADCSGTNGHLQAEAWLEAALWSPDNPRLCTVACSLEESSDREEIVTGLRHLAWSADRGLMINGQTVKLHGGCIHHDNGPLGAVSTRAIEARRVTLLKQAGFNAIRCAHNPPSTALLDECDRQGMMVIDEFFDAWREPKRPQDYHMFFEDWWERDVTAAVMRDRRHPSVVMWSTGNEVSEVGGSSGGFDVARMLAEKTRQLDDTRPVTSGMILLPDLEGLKSVEEIKKKLNAFYPVPAMANAAVEDMDNIMKNTFRPEFSHERDFYGDKTKLFADTQDVVGYNYMTDRYAFEAEKYPGRLLVGTETFPTRMSEYWRAMQRMPHVIGDFTWTAMDFLGEAGVGYVCHNRPWSANPSLPARTIGCGDLDICGFRKPFSYYRDILCERTKKPFIAVQHPRYYEDFLGMGLWSWEDFADDWTFPGWEGKPVRMDVYADCVQLEVYLDGKKIAEGQADESTGFRARFETVYQPGVLEARAILADGSIHTHSLTTAGEFAELRLTPFQAEIPVGDYGFAAIEAVDAAGTRLRGCEMEVHCTVEGGRLAALGTGASVTTACYVHDTIPLYEGRALLAVIADEAGNITIRAACGGRTYTTNLRVKPNSRKGDYAYEH